MSDIFNSYLTGEERKRAIDEAYYDHILESCNNSLEAIDIREKQMISDIEYKVLTESGTYDDYTYLLTEAENEIGEEKKSVLQKIADAITKLFRSIIDGIKSIFTSSKQGSPDDEIEVDSNKWNLIDKGKNSIQALTNGFSDAISRVKSGDPWGGLKVVWDTIPGILKAIAGVGAGVAAGTLIKVKRKDGEGKISLLQACITKLQDGFNTINSKLDSVANDQNKPGWLRNIADFGKKVLNAFPAAYNAINGFIKAIGDKLAAAKEVAGEAKIAGKMAATTAVDNAKAAVGKAANDAKTNAKVAGAVAADAAEDTVQKIQAAWKNNVETTVENGFTYILNKANGAIKVVNKAGTEISASVVKIPAKIKKAADEIKNAANEKNIAQAKQQRAQARSDAKFAKKEVNREKKATAADKQRASTIAAFHSQESANDTLDVEGYIVEETDDAYILTPVDNYIESTDESIFGVPAEDMVYESSNEELDKELDELSGIFESL